LPSLPIGKRLVTEAHNYKIKLDEDNIYNLMKHYRLNSMKKIELQVNMN